MSLPKSLNLWSAPGDHAGIMLVAINDGSTSGDCVFMLSPVSAECIQSPRGIVVSELKAVGESQIEVAQSDQGCTAIVRPVGLPEVTIQLNEDFEGEVWTTFDDEQSCLGTASPVKPRT